MLNLYHGDCLEVLEWLPSDSVDAIVTDPPYGISFMGKKWDYDVPSEAIWRECLRVLKPGGHLLAFSGSRTYHRMTARIEDAGFEIRDQIMWLYGSGFPKSLDVAKALDKEAGVERTVVGQVKTNLTPYGNIGGANPSGIVDVTAATSPLAQHWNGWGTALKPAHEPITVARKPFPGTVVKNVLKHGTGAINIDGCRIPDRDRTEYGLEEAKRTQGVAYGTPSPDANFDSTKGRWPANVIHDGHPEVTDRLPARFFYCAKTAKSDRDEGNLHPTVKPTDLMRYLVRLVTPTGGVVLDPFMGSGSTGKACVMEGFGFIGIEREAEYKAIAENRIKQADVNSLI